MRRYWIRYLLRMLDGVQRVEEAEYFGGRDDAAWAEIHATHDAGSPGWPPKEV